MSSTTLDSLRKAFPPTERMPALFLGHGSPMNAIEENSFVQGFRTVAQGIPRPQAILCVSAHWETRGTRLTAMEHPRTIHDFGGFPEALYEVEYPAPGSPVLAQEAKQLITDHPVDLDVHWGLDHGAWSVIKHLYPGADVPVVQMSLNRNMHASDHYALAADLQPLRDHGILIIGSGNMVHNLRMVDWARLHEQYAFDWAQEAGDKMKRFMLDDDHRALMEFDRQGAAFRLAIPTPEHYLPLLYTLALKKDKEPLSFFNDAPVAGSLTMTSVKIG
jgi:4,5-DOPA dioxygenase extradiol